MVSLMQAAYLAIAFVVYVIVVAVGGSILAGIQVGQVQTRAECLATPSLANCTTIASNATGYGLTGITNVANQSGTIGTVLGAVVLIGLIMGAFVMSK